MFLTKEKQQTVDSIMGIYAVAMFSEFDHLLWASS